jgi:preprotein translocase subunit YajC
MQLLLIYIVVIGGVFIFMTSRGNRRRQTQASQLQSALVVGAEVRTIGGMVGEVIEVTDEHVVVETTPGVKLRFVKSAIAGVVSPAEEEARLEGTDEEAEPHDSLPAGTDGSAADEEKEEAEQADDETAEPREPAEPVKR